MPGPALARDLVAGRHVDDVDGEVGEFRAEGGGEVVAAALDEEQFERREARHHVLHGGEVDGGVLADGGVRAAAGLDAGDALRRQRAGAGQEFRVLARVDVVGDDGDVVRAAEAPAQPLGQRRLAGAYGPADADPERSVVLMSGTASCTGSRGAWRAGRAPAPRCRAGRGRPRAPPRPLPPPPGCSAAVATCPSVWPSGTSLTPADTRLAAKAPSQPASAGRSGTPWKPAAAPKATGRGEAPRMPRGEGGEARLGPGGLRSRRRRPRPAAATSAPSPPCRARRRRVRRCRPAPRRRRPRPRARRRRAARRPRARRPRAARRRRSATSPARSRTEPSSTAASKPVAVGEAAHRVGRREPRQQPVERAGLNGDGGGGRGHAGARAAGCARHRRRPPGRRARTRCAPSRRGRAASPRSRGRRG